MKNLLTSLGGAFPDSALGKSAQLIDLLGSAVNLGLLQTGDKLPPENQLADLLNVSVPTLRDALAELRAQGLIETRRGRGGGSFLVESALDWQERGSRLLGRYSIAELRDLSDEACSLMGGAARIAAQRATSTDIHRLRTLADNARTATNEDEMAIGSSRFYIEVAVIAQSMFLTQAVVQMQSRLAPLLRASAYPEDYAEATHTSHDALIEAIARRQLDRAANLAADLMQAAVQKVIADKLNTDYAVSSETHEDSGLTPIAEYLNKYFGDWVKATRQEAAHVVGDMQAGHRGAQIVAEAHRRAAAYLDRFPAAAGTGPIFDAPPEPTNDECVYWWIHGPEGLAERRTMDTVTGNVRFYDFRMNRWFAVPQADNISVLQGPYVDYLGYDAYIVTISAPMLTEENEFLGVYAMDLEVKSLEETLIPVLRRLNGYEVALITEEARVLVSSTGRWASGELLDLAIPHWQRISIAPMALGLVLMCRPINS